MNTNIKLALSGQIYDMSSMLLDAVGCERTDACWQSLPVDAGNITYILKEVTESSNGYILWHNVQHGLYVSYTKRSARRSGFVMITLCMGHKRVINAEEFCEGLNCLLQVYMSAGNLVGVDKSRLQAILNELERCLVDGPKVKIFSENADAQLAYTTYSSKQQLYDILMYPQQDAYRSYGKLYVIPQENAKPSASGFFPIQVNVKKAFRLVLDSNSEFGKVEFSPAMVREGERYTINYIANGCEPVVKEEIAGVNSDFSYLDAKQMQIVIKGYDKVRDKIKKQKIITFKIHSENSNKEVSEYQIYVDGKCIALMGQVPSIKFEEKEYTIEIAARGYSKYKFKLDTRTMQNRDTYDVKLVPDSVKVPLTIRYEKVDYSGKISLNYDNQLYKPLTALSGETLVSSKRQSSMASKKTLIIVIIAAVLAAVICGIVGSNIGYKKGVKAEEKKYEAIKKKWISHDETYLKNNTTWKLCDLQSLEYTEQLEQILKGENVPFSKDVHHPTYKEVRYLLDSLGKYDTGALGDFLKAYEKEINLEKLKTAIPGHIEKILIIKDSTYLVNHNVWKVADLNSTKYKNNFMTGIRAGNVKGLAEHKELDANTTWKDIRQKLATNANGIKDIVIGHYSSDEVNLDELWAVLGTPVHEKGTGTGAGRNRNGVTTTSTTLTGQDGHVTGRR